MTLQVNLMGLGVNPSLARYLGDTVEAAVAATGTAQGTAYAIKATITEVLTATGASADSVRLPLISAIDKDPYIVKNNSAATINIFPGTGDNINALSANAAITLAAGAGLEFYRKSATGWLTA